MEELKELLSRMSIDVNSSEGFVTIIDTVRGFSTSDNIIKLYLKLREIKVD